jgi:hypothetical protein
MNAKDEDSQSRKGSLRSRIAHAIKDDLGRTPEAQARIKREKEERLARYEARVAAEQDASDNSFEGVWLKDGRVYSEDGGGPVAGARATVDTAGQLTARITATRLVLTGPLALGWRKSVDNRELYLLIEGSGWAISAP